MAIMTSPDDMGRAGVNQNNSITQGQRRAPVMESAEGAVSLQRQLGEIGNQIYQSGIDLEKVENDRRERENRLAIVHAKSNFHKANIGIKAGINDEDYGTYINRYDEGIGKARSQILETVKDPYAREMLQAEIDVSIEEGKLAMFSKSQKVETDLGRAQTEDIIESQLEMLAVAQSEVDYEDGLVTVQETIQAAQANNYISAEQAEEKWDEAKESYATTRYNALNPAEQLAVLEKGQGWIEHIPASKRVVAKKQAKRAVDAENKAVEADRMKAEAFNYVDDWEDLEMSAEEMDAAAQKLPAKQREYVEDRLTKVMRKNKLMEQDRANDNYDEWHMQIQGDEEGAENPVSYKDIPDQVLEEMTPAQRDTLKKISEEKYNSKPAPKYSDFAVIDTLNILSQDETPEGRLVLRGYYSENAASLSVKDRNAWSKASSKAYKKVPRDIKGLYSVKERTAQAAKGVGDNLKGALQNKMADWYTSYLEANDGKLPTDKQTTEVLDKLLMQDGDWFSGNEYAFEEGYDGEITADFIMSTDPSGFEQLQKEFTEMYGTDYTEQDLVDTWKAANGSK